MDHVERIYPYIFKETEHTQNSFIMKKYCLYLTSSEILDSTKDR